MAAFASACEAVTGWRFIRLPFLAPIPSRVVALAGWGRKIPVASRVARFVGLPFVSIEDGFLRSVRVGPDGDPPLSLVVDLTGVHYDARSPSDLETLLERGGWETPELTARAEAGIAAIRRLRLSKYNDGLELDDVALGLPPRREGRRRVLVIDQTRGDKSIVGGLARDDTFGQMLDAAVAENPGADILIKSHPSVIAGKRRGHFDATVVSGRATMIAAKVNPWSLLERVDRVYAVSSQMGFEAVLAGLPVTCFGMPFYAGWGITDDRVACARRTRRRTVAEVFAAAYLVYARYVDADQRRPATFEVCVDTLSRLVAVHRNQPQSPQV